MTIAAEGDDPEDPNWRFDPENPPEKFTRRMLGRMSIAHLLLCADHEKSPLDEPQQASFDKAYAELNRDISNHIGAAVQAAMPKLEWPTPDIDLSALAPKIDLAFTSNSAYEALSESTRASFERIQRNLITHLDVAQRLSLPQVASKVPSREQRTPDEPTHPKDSDLAAPQVDAEQTGAPLRDVTPNELLDEVDEDLSQLALLGTMVQLLEEQGTLMRKQSGVVRSQQESAARGAVFYVVVGLGSALSGIATLVGLDNWAERVWALVLTGALAIAALAGYYEVRMRQGKGDRASEDASGT